MPSYAGPERRTRGDPADREELRGMLTRLLEAHKEHSDRRLDDLKEHFDAKLEAQNETIAEIKAQVEPVHEVFVTGKNGARILKWVIGTVLTLGALWTAIKGWLLGVIIK